MAKRDDDGFDLIDPFKFMIGCFKVLFGIFKALYNGLTSSDPFVRVVTIIFVILALSFFGFWAYMPYYEMQREYIEGREHIQSER